MKSYTHQAGNYRFCIKAPAPKWPAFIIGVFSSLLILCPAPTLSAKAKVGVVKAVAEWQMQKLINSDQIVSGFNNGQEKIKVIVSLSAPGRMRAALSLGLLTEDRKIPESVKNFRVEIANRQVQVLSSLTTFEFTLRHRYKNFASFSGKVTANGLAKLLNNPLVKSIEPVRRQHPLLVQGIALINATTPRLSYNGQGIAIAISDTGVDYTHPMFGGGGFPNSKVIGGYDTGGAKTNVNDPDSDPFPYGPGPDNAHGTCSAGIAAGDLATVGDYVGGVAHNAKIYAMKISADDDNGAWDDDIIAAWDWCITHQNDDPNNPIMVISHSFGGGRYYSAAEAESAEPAFADAANTVVAAGITVLAASGNDGFCDSLVAPAAFSSVISVGAVYDAALGNISFCIDSGSCIGENQSDCDLSWGCFNDSTADMVTCYSNTASFMDILAPSHNAYTTDIAGSAGYSSGDYESQFGGTSAACPYAAGAVACLQSAAKAISDSYLTPAEVRGILISTGNNITDGKVAITKPRVNLGRAIEALTSPPVAFDDSVTTEIDTPVTITLGATDEGMPDPPGALSYIITSLPVYGSLTDPCAGEITTVPYTLAENGNELVYATISCYSGSDSFSFKANDGGTEPTGGDSNIATITINIINIIYLANMDADPGWILDPGQGLSKWQWEIPSGGGGQYGNPDPTSGYTGLAVIGYNLAGDYRNKIASTEWATTPAIDCSGFTNVKLKFYRWLNVEQPDYDHAYIEVSNNGSSFNRIWENTAEITDSSWTLQTFDISSIADGQSTVFIRWGMGPTEDSRRYSGWNIDDVELIGTITGIVGDFEPDCDVDFYDYAVLAAAWLSSPSDDNWCQLCDISEPNDNIIDQMDLAVLAENWLQ